MKTAGMTIAGTIVLILALYLFMPMSGSSGPTITYPLDGTIFPPDLASPTVLWDDDNPGAGSWTVSVDFSDGSESVSVTVDRTAWTPDPLTWKVITDHSLEQTATITVTRAGSFRFGARDGIEFTTSLDPVGAPIFFRDVPLPFRYAVEHMDSIRWRLGDVASYEPPKVVLENMMMCGNCHSFTGDGATLAMDIDYANDKGSYVITPIEREIDLTGDKIITWSDYKREDGESTFGLLSQISPDGRYVVSTVKDRSVFVPVEDLYYSQLFFPLKGILAYYDIDSGEFHDVPGASDPYYVQSNPSWSPDSKWLVFARNVADSLRNVGNAVVLEPADCEEYLTGGKKFRFDLYRVPFNDGGGGEPEPLPGASEDGVSEYFAKYSPDGKWIVFCRSDSFMLLQPDSALYIIPAEGGEPRRMNCNTSTMNSWHSWSPNGRWIVFSAKLRGPYTQLYLTHIDENGMDSPPVLIERFLDDHRAANIPEFVDISMNELDFMHERFIDAYSYVRKADDFVKFMLYDRAEEMFRKAIELSPDYAEAHSNLGSLFTRLDRVEEAEAEWIRAAELNPDDAATHLGLGIISLNREKYDDARREFEIAIRLDDACAGAYEGLGVIHYINDESDEARRMFEAAVSHDNRLADAWFRLGTIYLAAGDTELGQDALSRVVSLKYDPEALLLLGRIHFDKEEYEDALKAFDIVYRNDSEDPRATFMLARVLATRERTMPRAVEFMERTVTLMPDNVEAWIELGNVRLKLKDRTGAVSAFEKALMLDPDAAGLREYVEKLKQ